MDLLDVAILLLRIALVAVLYLFLLAVVRSATRSFRPAPVPEAPPSRLTLVVLDPAGAVALEPGERVELDAGMVIGRAAPADLIVADQAVSGQHARVDYADGAWRVSDLGSTNGTRLNDRPVVSPSRLRRGDRLELGPVRFEVGDTA